MSQRLKTGGKEKEKDLISGEMWQLSLILERGWRRQVYVRAYCVASISFFETCSCSTGLTEQQSSLWPCPYHAGKTKHLYIPQGEHQQAERRQMSTLKPWLALVWLERPLSWHGSPLVITKTQSAACNDHYYPLSKHRKQQELCLHLKGSWACCAVLTTVSLFVLN